MIEKDCTESPLDIAGTKFRLDMVKIVFQPSHFFRKCELDTKLVGVIFLKAARGFPLSSTV